MSLPLLPLLGAMCGGLATAIQIPLNAALARSLGGPLPATAVSFGVGFVVLALASLAAGGVPLSRFATIPMWQFAGGLLGAIYVSSAVWSLPSLGAVTAIAAIILGQMVGGLVLDHIGAFGMVVQEITAKRVLAVGLVVSGLILSRI